MSTWRETARGSIDPRDASIRLSAENAARVERVRLHRAERLLDAWIINGGWRLMPFAEYVDACG